MGIEIVKASIVHGKRLSGNAYKVLIAMSVSALDKPSNGRPASLYWGGWDALAVTLGYDDAARGSAGHNAVARAVRELKKARHVSSLIEAGRGSRQSYMVHPGGLHGSGMREQNAHAKGEQSAHARGEQNAHVSVSKTLTPRTHKDSGGQNEDTSIASETKPQTAREGENTSEIRPHKFEGNPAAGDCLTCDRSHLDRKAHPMRLVRGETA